MRINLAGLVPLHPLVLRHPSLRSKTLSTDLHNFVRNVSLSISLNNYSSEGQGSRDNAAQLGWCGADTGKMDRLALVPCNIWKVLPRDLHLIYGPRRRKTRATTRPYYMRCA